ncbi:unnamed protein product [Allacma fusca]|uniref:Uncharacterized protein n=1 Tax=Allacma fusca TaxID=39272 RepID=A0A8J2LRZ0_9HEXA|nr:unnamed protein product [Allacma fusca]
MSPKKGRASVPDLNLSSPGSSSSGPWSPTEEDFNALIAEQEGQWSPTKTDFDKLMAEQDCFEISFREEKKKNECLTKDFRRLKEESKKNRQAYMKLAQELQALTMKCAGQEKVIKTQEDLLTSQSAQIEDMQKKLTELKAELAASECKMQPSVISTSKDLNNNNDFNTDFLTMSGPVKPHIEDRGPRPKNRRSLVSQLVQGFEAVVAAKTLEFTAESKSARRKTTIPLIRNE